MSPEPQVARRASVVAKCSKAITGDVPHCRVAPVEQIDTTGEFVPSIHRRIVHDDKQVGRIGIPERRRQPHRMLRGVAFASMGQEAVVAIGPKSLVERCYTFLLAEADAYPPAFGQRGFE